VTLLAGAVVELHLTLNETNELPLTAMANANNAKN
jgi:hypothetical protein